MSSAIIMGTGNQSGFVLSIMMAIVKGQIKKGGFDNTTDLSSAGLKVISIYGSEDGVLNMEKYAANKMNLPASFEEHIIDGGCHAGFGSYGAQDGDGTPTITGDAQIEETVFLITDFFTETAK